MTIEQAKQTITDIYNRGGTWQDVKRIPNLPEWAGHLLGGYWGALRFEAKTKDLAGYIRANYPAKSMQEVADELKVSPTYAYKVARNHGIAIGRPCSQPRKAKGDANPVRMQQLYSLLPNDRQGEAMPLAKVIYNYLQVNRNILGAMALARAGGVTLESEKALLKWLRKKGVPWKGARGVAA